MSQVVLLHALRQAAVWLIFDVRPKSMALLARVVPTMSTRPCRFCISLQGDSVFADFDVDEEDRVFLRRISFDRFGCCHGEFKKMSADNSRSLLASVEQASLEDPKIEMMLRSYFRDNAGVIWDDALTTHGLLEPDEKA